MSDDIGMILDVTPGDYEQFERELLEGMGHRVEVCRGPAGLGGVCPALEGAGCQRMIDAHGIVFKLDLDRPKHRAILEHYKTQLADTPIAASVRPGQETTYADLLDGLYIWDHTPSTADLDGFAALVEANDTTK